MATQGFRERILEVDVAGTAVGNSTSETTLLPVNSFATLPAFFFDTIKKRIVFEFSGQGSNRVTGPDTVKFRLFLGAVAVFDSGLIPLNIVAKTNVNWKISGELIARPVGTGTTTTLFPKGIEYKSENVIGSPLPSVGGSGVLLLPFNTPPAVGTGFDNSTSALIDLKLTHSVANAANTFQLMAGHIDVYT